MCKFNLKNCYIHENTIYDLPLVFLWPSAFAGRKKRVKIKLTTIHCSLIIRQFYQKEISCLKYQS